MTLIAAKMLEADLEEEIRKLALRHGILRFHVRDPRGMVPGFPDDILIGNRGLLWRECKNATRAPTPEQRTVGRALLALGQDWALWRPHDLLDGKIEDELRRIA